MATASAELMQVLRGLPDDVLVGHEADHSMLMDKELRRFGLMLATSDDQPTYEDIAHAPTEHIYSPAQIEDLTIHELHELLGARIRELGARRNNTRHAYVGISLWSPTRWRTYRQSRTRWRKMQEILVVRGVGAGAVIGMLERDGIQMLHQLQQQGDALVGAYHSDLSNRTSGGEGVREDARYYVLYLVTEDDGPV